MRQFWAATVFLFFFAFVFFIAKPLYPAMLDCALIDIFILLHVSLVQHLQRVLLVVNDNIHQFWAVFVFDIVFPREHATILGSARIPFFFFSLFFYREAFVPSNVRLRAH